MSRVSSATFQISSIAAVTLLLGLTACSDDESGEMFADTAIWSSIADEDVTLIERDGRCFADLGSFQRENQTANLSFYREGGRGGLEIAIDGWEGPEIGATIMKVVIAGQTFPLNGSVRRHAKKATIWGTNNNGHWISGGLQNTSQVHLTGAEIIGGYLFESSQFQQAGLALEQCAKRQKEQSFKRNCKQMKQSMPEIMWRNQGC